MDPLVRLAMRESRGDTAADYASYVSCSLIGSEFRCPASQTAASLIGSYPHLFPQFLVLFLEID